MNKSTVHTSAHNIAAISSTNSTKPGNNIRKALQLAWLSAATLAFFAILTPTKASATVIAGPILDPATGHDYYLLDSNTWTASQSQALTLGGNMVTINDAAENAWVFSEFADYGGVQRNLWLGLNAIGLNGGNAANFSWIDGESATYRNWAAGQPDFSDQYTVMVGIIGSPALGEWNNVADIAANGYASAPAIGDYGVVEVVPEPGTRLLVLLGSLLLGVCAYRRSAAAIRS